jgi:hypothetical protein
MGFCNLLHFGNATTQYRYLLAIEEFGLLKADYRPDDENKALLSIPVLMQEMLKQNL